MKDYIYHPPDIKDWLRRIFFPRNHVHFKYLSLNILLSKGEGAVSFSFVKIIVCYVCLVFSCISTQSSRKISSQRDSKVRLRSDLVWPKEMIVVSKLMIDWSPWVIDPVFTLNESCLAGGSYIWSDWFSFIFEVLPPLAAGHFSDVFSIWHVLHHPNHSSLFLWYPQYSLAIIFFRW